MKAKEEKEAGKKGKKMRKGGGGKESPETLLEEVEVPEKASAKIENNILEVNGPKGRVSKDLNKIQVNVAVDDKKIIIKPLGTRKKYLSIMGTAKSIARNMVEGVVNGYTYRLKVIYAHFPITVKVKDGYIYVENFLGERSPRTVKIIGDTKARMDGEDLLVQGPSLEDVSQTAGNVELATKIKEKDLRVFLDGLYVYAREKGM